MLDFGLRRHVVGLHRDADVDRAPEIVQPDLPAGAVERDLADAGHLRARIVEKREAERAAVALAAPVRHLRHPLDHRAGARRVLEQVEPEFHRIDALLGGDLVEEAFAGELVGGEADAAQRRGPHAGVLEHLLDELVGHVVAGEVGAEHQDAVAPVAALVADRIGKGQNPIAGDAVLEGDDLAGRIETGLEIVRRERPEAAVLDVVLARPHHLDGALGLLRHQHRIDDELLVAVAAPAEAAAHQHVVELDLVAGDAERLGGRLLRHALALGAAPDLRRVAGGRHRGDGVERLHLRVIGVVAAVFRFQRARGRGHRGLRVAHLAPFRRRGFRIARGRRKSFDTLVAVETPAGAGARPGDRAVERLARRERAPGGLGEHADPIGQAHDLHDAGDRLDPRLVDLVGRGALDRRAHHHAVEHVGHVDVDRVFGAAVHLAGQLDAGDVLADQPELRRLLELIGLDLRRLLGNLGELRDLAVAQPPAGPGVHHRVGLGGQLLDRHVRDSSPHCRAARGAPVRRTCAAA